MQPFTALLLSPAGKYITFWQCQKSNRPCLYPLLPIQYIYIYWIFRVQYWNHLLLVKMHNKLISYAERDTFLLEFPYEFDKAPAEEERDEYSVILPIQQIFVACDMLFIGSFCRHSQVIVSHPSRSLVA